MVARAEDRFDGVSALVNNAGMEIQAGIEELGESQFESMLRTNVLGPFLCIQETLPLLKRSGGAIVNIGSTVVTRAPRNRFGYVATKGALEAMSRALAGDLGHQGIRVNVVRPGIIPSELRGSTERDEIATLEQRASGLQALPVLGRGTDVAGVVAFLVSADASWITGAVLDVDGGYVLGIRR
jgi:NAD(P)-dependent dehydrogenase (short-subunit alcohol dehydrogenase family)